MPRILSKILKNNPNTAKSVVEAEKSQPTVQSSRTIMSSTTTEFDVRKPKGAQIKTTPTFDTDSEDDGWFQNLDGQDAIAAIRMNLPEDPLLQTPFGTRRMTYADYTASGRSLRFIEDYIQQIIIPMYANTHTETSASGLQTTHYREEARSIIMKELHADPKEYSLIFTGSGTTGAIWKLIALLGIHCPAQLRSFLDTKKMPKTLIFISQCEHHSNELMWRETIADVIAVPMDKSGSLDLKFLENMLSSQKANYKLIIGSFTAGSNVTGLTTKPGPVASLMHKYGGYVCFDYAAAGPYRDMSVANNIPGDPDSYLDAIFVSPHKFVGGPGTPGLLCIRKSFANCRNGMQLPPTVAGGGTVSMVWPSGVFDGAGTNRLYDASLHVREEAGTPGILESIRCGLVFHTRGLVGIQTIEEMERYFAVEAVRRMMKKKIWVMGDVYSNISSSERLSITSFNIWCKLPNYKKRPEDNDIPQGTFAHPVTGKPLMLHFHFVAALLNDLYGIQARSGCACAGPLAFRLYGPKFPFMTQEAFSQFAHLAKEDYHALKPGFCRVNFNYFIGIDEFDYIMSAIEQIAEHGWKLLPLYKLCLRTGQYRYNGVTVDDKGNYCEFDRFATVRRLKEVKLDRNASVGLKNSACSKETRFQYLNEAMKIYERAPMLVRRMLIRFGDFQEDVKVPSQLQRYRFFVLGSEVLPYLGIPEKDLRASTASNPVHDLQRRQAEMTIPQLGVQTKTLKKHVKHVLISI